MNHQLFDYFDFGLWHLDARGNTIFANKWLRLFLQNSVELELQLNFFEEINKIEQPFALAQQRSNSIEDLVVGSRYLFTDRKSQTKMFHIFKVIDLKGLNLGDGFLVLGGDSFPYSELKVYYQNLQDLGEIGVWELDTQTGKTFWSEEVYRIHGVSPLTPTDKVSGIDFYAPEERERLVQCISDASQGKSFKDVFRFFDTQGNEKWVQVMGEPVFNDEQKVHFIKGTFRDMTQQQNAERVLKESMAELGRNRERLSLALESASLGTWNWNLKTNHVVFDQQWAAIRGLKQDQLQHNLEDWSSRVHPDDLKEAYQDIQNYIAGLTSSFRNTHRVRHQDGSWRYILGRGRFAEFDSSGKPILFIGTDADVTAQINSQIVTRSISELRNAYITQSNNQSHFFETVLNHLIKVFESEYGFIGEIRKDHDGQPYLKTFALTDISWDDESRALFEKSAANGLEFRNLNTLFGEVIKTGQILCTNSASSHPKSGGTPKGHPPLNSFLGIPIYYSNQFIAMVGLANNPEGYDQKSLEYFDPLFQAIGDMIHSLRMSAEIDQQRQLANHKSKLATIGEMASGVGHEINNPLAIISGQLALLKKQLSLDETADKKLLNRIEKSEKAVDRISHIVKGLRSFSRSDGSTHTDFNFSELVQETVEMVTDVYRIEGVELLSHIGDQFWTNGNRGRWQQVIMNLLGNAKDAVQTMPRKLVEVTLKKLDSDSFELQVKDTGTGIPFEIRHKIFDPFFTTKEVNHGTGIGLALTNTIILEHQAKISYETEENRGTTFKIVIPRKIDLQ